MAWLVEHLPSVHKALVQGLQNLSSGSSSGNWTWWHMPVMSALERWGQEDKSLRSLLNSNFKAILG